MDMSQANVHEKVVKEEKTQTGVKHVCYLFKYMGANQIFPRLLESEPMGISDMYHVKPEL